MKVSSQPFNGCPADPWGAASSACPHARTLICLQLLWVPLSSPCKGCATMGQGEVWARNNRVQHRTELNSRKYLQITKSMAWQQGHSEGSTHGPFAANPWQELDSSSLLQSPHFPSTFSLAKMPWSLQQKKLPRKRLIYSKRV